MLIILFLEIYQGYLELRGKETRGSWKLSHPNGHIPEGSFPDFYRGDPRTAWSLLSAWCVVTPLIFKFWVAILVSSQLVLF